MLFCCNLTSGIVGFLLLSQGWQQVENSEICIEGNSYFKREKIINSMSYPFPSRTLDINPKQLEANTLRNIPIKAISISRRIGSCNLHVQVLEREPIAFAKRRLISGEEIGFIDIDAVWIPLQDSYEPRDILKKLPNLHIEGWMKSRQQLIAHILRHREILGSPLKKILLTRNGEINLQTEFFDLVKLGSNPSLINQQLIALSHLSLNLPNKYKGKQKSSIDLTNPNKPKMDLLKK